MKETMKNLKVLIVEDEKIALDYLAQIIREEGFQTLTSENGKDALAKLLSEKPDILITDYKLPGISGLEIMETARKLIPSIKIIIITAFGDTNLAISAIQNGALDYFKKPIDPIQIRVALGRAKEKITEDTKTIFKPNIMIVDDEEDAKNYVALFLKKEKDDWNIFMASDGIAALDLFKEKKIDVVLIDIKMPKKNGLQAIHEMREISSDFESIVLTGHGDESDAIQALRDGTMNFLKKPIDIEEVLINVEKALEKLLIKRTLMYRFRDNELSNEIIAKVTNENKFIINAHHLLTANAVKFVEEIIDTLPLGIAIIDNKFKIIYINSQASQLMDNPQKIDDHFIHRLNNFGIDCSLDCLLKEIESILKESQGHVRKIKTSKFSCLTLMQILWSNQISQNPVVLMGINWPERIDNKS
ncbi:MAG: response regulator [Oligoflexia bacterium]|nr:response regulator [Oligoflexia bacterium]